MPWTTGFCMVGAASISAFPLFSGFITKSMIMTAAAGEGYVAVWLVLLFASAGVFHHAGIKIPYFAFFSHDSGIRCREAPGNMLAAMALAAALCIGIGVFPGALYALSPWPVDYEPYTASHVLSQLQLLVFSALAFSVLMRTGVYPPELRLVNIDSDVVYRRWVPGLLRGIGAAMHAASGRFAGVGEGVLGRVVALLERHHGVDGVLARTWTTGGMALCVAVLLAAYLAVYYVYYR
jgi:multicomponent Na+:H+ antiporter subunit D